MSASPAPAALLNEVVGEYNATALAAAFPFLASEFQPHLFQIDLGLKHLAVKTGGVLLDIGTGRGIIPRFFRKLNFRCITLDHAAAAGEALATAKQAGIEALECDCSSQRFPVDSDSVDCVYLADVIEHLPHSPRFMLEEIHRVLRPGGICITTTPNAVRLTVRVKMLLGASNWPHIKDYYDAPFHMGHHHEYTEPELRLVHERAGFQIAEFRTLELNLLTAPVDSYDSLHSQARSQKPARLRYGVARRVLSWVTDLAPKLRSQMYLVARKKS